MTTFADRALIPGPNPAQPVTPHPDPATDTVLVSRVCWVDATAHRPDDTEQRPACAAEAERWFRIGAYLARMQLNSVCRAPQCYPHGWLW